MAIANIALTLIMFNLVLKLLVAREANFTKLIPMPIIHEMVEIIETTMPISELSQVLLSLIIVCIDQTIKSIEKQI